MKLIEFFIPKYGDKTYTDKSILDAGVVLLIASQGTDNGVLAAQPRTCTFTSRAETSLSELFSIMALNSFFSRDKVAFRT